MPSLTEELKAEARRLGFQLSGSCPAVSPAGIHRFYEWLASGYGGEMHYLSNRAAAYEHPRSILDGARSILMLGMHYANQPPATIRPSYGRVSRYAWGSADYHDVIHGRLKQLAAWLTRVAPNAKVRGVVDTAPLLEREFAQLAGIGWIGKNTMLITRDSGSYFFLAALLTDVELDYDSPHQTDHCGTCVACLEACPTDAFPQPYQLDARRCTSYLTIELRSPIPSELRGAMGEWLFGCDICQDVCPWNSRAAVSNEVEFEPRHETNPLELGALFDLDETAFRQLFRHTPLWRPKRRGLLRNAAIVLGNQRMEAACGPLMRGLTDDEPLVRGASAWALGRLHRPEARAALQRHLDGETDDAVRGEVRAALQRR